MIQHIKIKSLFVCTFELEIMRLYDFIDLKTKKPFVSYHWMT